ncbi:MAG TPA: nucleoside-diphosphate sugar epimerase/dehydratase [Alphaproteobacteria bacterium]|nr:nucleoside-diphosphate sugar epimerase/dehydratase [Alphaproteobacteria bacterium]
MARLNRTLTAFVHDLGMAALAYTASLYLRLGSFNFSARGPWLEQMGIFVAICGLAYWMTGLYRGIWRYTSVRDLGNIVKAATLAVAAFMPICFLLTRLEGIPRSVPGILWFVLIGFLSGPRVFVRLLKEGRLDNFWLGAKAERINVLVVGAGDEAELYIRAVMHDRQSPYHIVGVLDDKESRVGREIHHVSVLAPMRELPRVFRELKAKGQTPRRLVISRAASRAEDFGSFLAEAQGLNLSLSRLPLMTDLHEGAQRPELAPIDLSDLLGRPETALDRQAISSFVNGKNVLITGAGGTIGSEIARQIAALNPSRLTLVENSEFNLYSVELELREAFPALDLSAVIADVREAGRIMRLFEEHRPAVIFHAAALKHVPMAEANVREALLTNVIGTRNVADAAASIGAQAMVLISTDKAVNPTSVMGASKRMAEHYCQSLDHENTGPTRFLTVRFGNVLGSTGSVVPRFKEQLMKGGPLTVTHPEITRYFMTVMEAVELVLQACAHGVNSSERGRIMVLDMGRPIKIADLARQMIRLAGLQPDSDVKIIYTGLRPGEKLHEELFGESEKLAPAGVDGVLLAAAAPLPLSHVQSLLRDLGAAVQDAAALDDTLRLKIGYLVPEFTQANNDAAKKVANG